MHRRGMMCLCIPHHHAHKVSRPVDPAIRCPASEDRAHVLSTPADTGRMGLAAEPVQASTPGRRQSGKCKWSLRRRVQGEGVHTPPADSPTRPTADRNSLPYNHPRNGRQKSSPLSRCSQSSAPRSRPRRCRRKPRCATPATITKTPTTRPSASSSAKSAATRSSIPSAGGSRMSPPDSLLHFLSDRNVPRRVEAGLSAPLRVEGRCKGARIAQSQRNLVKDGDSAFGVHAQVTLALVHKLAHYGAQGEKAARVSTHA
jgi:hypothetical protein